MHENEIKLKAIAALTALRSDVGEDLASELLAEVIPSRFLVPAEGGPEEIGGAVLDQLSAPLSALVNGFIAAFAAVADAYDETDTEPGTGEILQELALRLAREGGGQSH
ncbi:hypothetical protein OHS33_00405 [Streptomyces sp. NBC_00536]|uniref:hypothetical protein n=1 Tax=Streptomyces sp. NBC_00536 TaxID=2975769 RepID=UPI002E806BF2|nr:hypothetical protein [Streptomyces sp. NBC_00536]WUC76940.1 hypothetical protein OHS33_00405 [Streptomyces sp. NBC_00536]